MPYMTDTSKPAKQNDKPKTVKKTVLMDESMAEEIEAMGAENQRKFSAQVVFMLKQALRRKPAARSSKNSE